ncbi:MAG: DNA polymerase III subunit gamma/tau [Oscillospiraceae bacterium]|nr:DNA polymerase III subunit gamma/tau [Oscillospiraceae bacterium]
MTYQALYRKWRPLTFDDLVGQEHISRTLQNEIINDRVAHAYLFCGTRGTGKTSTAKIFARALNCTNPQNGNPCNICDTCKGILDGSIMDVYEMDAASNNGVDNIREIRDEVAYTPSHGKYKIYIIDEVHMLSGGAFNALLKTLEEPPSHVIFILATTEPHKIPATILSRCQRFDFRRITINDIAARLLKISAAEGINITPDAAEVIASIADGSMRDAVSALDQCAARGLEEIRAADVSNILGIADKANLFAIAEAIADGDTSVALVEIGSLIDHGAEVLNLFEDLISHYRNLLICKASGGNASSAAALIDKTEDAAAKYLAQAEKYTNAQIIRNITILSEYVLTAKWMSQPRVALEMAIVRATAHEEQRTDSGTQKSIENKVPVTKPVPEPIKVPAPEPKPEPISAPQPPVPAAESVPKPPPPSPAAEPAAEMKADVPKDQLWAEALNAIKAKSKQLFGFLSPAKVNISGNTAEIAIANSIAYERVGTPEGIKYLEDLFLQLGGEQMTVSVTKGSGGETANATAPQFDGIDEIIEKQEQFGDVMQVE